MFEILKSTCVHTEKQENNKTKQRAVHRAGDIIGFSLQSLKLNDYVALQIRN